MITATLDTNCINVKRHYSLDIIYKLYHDCKIKLYKTDTLDTELIFSNPKSVNNDRLNKSNELEEDKGIAYWGNSRWGHCLWSNGDNSFVEEFKKIIFKDYDKMKEDKKKRAFKDCMHLNTHLIKQRDYFITVDKHFLKNKEVLKKVYNLNVINPNDFLELEAIRKIR